ncbi:MAG: hypothetical protein WC797_03015 [Candidatus Paceibacterota bacterium]|jgi:hypothetical protein
MENKLQNDVPEEFSRKKIVPDVTVILISSIILAGTWIYTSGVTNRVGQQSANTLFNQENVSASELEEKVLPSKGVTLPVEWGDMGSQLVDKGVIDAGKLKDIYEKRNNFTDEYQKLLSGKNNGKLKITNKNSGYILNLLWAVGLANKNPILETGEMSDPSFGGAQSFASTGGWTVSDGDPMDHFSGHKFFNLTVEQQALVDKISRGIYRPCCGNSTHFPDCNHGMAMLGLLEMMAFQGVSEQDMWKTALVVNSYWFPNNYLAIAEYMGKKGVDWADVDPQEILGFDYSSSQGYKNIVSKTSGLRSQRGEGSGCGIDSSSSTKQEQQVGCGI